MNKISESLLIAKAKRQLGEDIYSDLKKSFLDAFKKICEDENENKFCKKSLKQLWLLKNQMWVQSLCQILGPATIGASIYRCSESSPRETIITCIIGALMATISSFRKRETKGNYQTSEAEFLNYISERSGLNINIDNTHQSIQSVPYKDACHKLVEQAKDYDLWHIERSM